MVLIDVVGNVMECRPLAKTILGERAEMIVGNHISQLITLEDWGKVAAHFESMLTNHQVHPILPYFLHAKNFLVQFTPHVDHTSQKITQYSVSFFPQYQTININGQSVQNWDSEALDEVQHLRELNIMLQEREKELYLLFNSFSHAMVIFNLNGQVIQFNKQAASIHMKYTGLKLNRRSSLQDMPFLKSLFFFQGFWDACLRGQKLRKQFALQSPVRDIATWYELSLMPFRNAQGEIIAITCLMDDITDRKLNQSQLQLFEAIILNTKDCVLVTEASPITMPGPRIVFANPAFLETMGYTLEEIVGKTPRMFQGPKTDRKATLQIKQAIKEGVPVEVELINYTKSGDEIWVRISISPVFGQDGNITHYVSLQDNITERKKLEIERLQMIRSLSEQNEKLEHFRYIISHNLRAPVASIGGLTKLFDTFSTSIQDPDVLQIVRYLSTASERLDTVIRDLNEFLEKQKDDRALLEWVDLAELMTMVKQMLFDELHKAEASLHIELGENALQIFSIKSYLLSIVQNLIWNAIKYRADRPLVITLQSWKEAESIRISVRDNGQGMPPDFVREKLFQMYQRSHPDIPGKGFGLFMTKSEVETLGGRIWAESELGVGTVFFVEFPINDLEFRS